MSFTMDKVILVCVVMCCVFSSVFCQEQDAVTDVNEGRTFGHHLLKRLSFAIIPTAFVVGVITTLLAALTVVSIKGLGVGIILLVISVGQIIARTFTAAPLQAHTHAAQIPIVYSRSVDAHAHEHEAPIWIEKQWSR